MREEITLEIVGNQKVSQRGKGINQEDQKIAGTMENQGTRRKINGLKRILKEKIKMETRRKIW